MAKKLNDYLEEIPYRNWSTGLIVANLFVIIFIILFLPQLPPIIPLFYGRAYGPDQLSPQHLLALPPAIAVVICLINTTINTFLKDEFLRKVLLGAMIVYSLLSIITVVKIIFLVGNI